MKGSKGFAALEALKNEFEIQREAEELRWHEEMVKRHDELRQRETEFPSETLKEKYTAFGKLGLINNIAKKWMDSGMKETPEEMIDYLMSGKKIVDRTGQSFQFVDGAVEFIYEIYDEGAGPQGFGKKYQTLAQFKKFIYGTLNENKDGEWMPIWVKEEEYEF